VKSNKVFSNCLNQKIYVIQWLKVSGSFSETKTIFCRFVTVVDTLADSYVLKSSEVSGFAAEMAFKRKHSIYSSIIQRGNAASIWGTFPDSAILSEIFVL
jgi:hypothetical protein